MELFFTTLLCIFLSSIFLSIHLLFLKSSNAAALPPPGKTGWPVIGENLEFLSAGWKGHPEKFVLDRMSKYSSAIFRTGLFGDHFAVFCGPAGNKFLFSNENKLVKSWWPKGMDRIFPNSPPSNSVEATILRKVVATVLKPDSLHRYVPVMDHIARRHFADEWENKERVTVFPLAKNYTFWIACHLFISMEDPDDQFRKFRDMFDGLISGLLSVPIAVPGTPFWTAIKMAECIRKELVAVIRKRKIELADGTVSPTQDILSLMLVSNDKSGKSMTEMDIADKIIGALIAGHDTTTSVCAMIVKYLAELPHVYDAVYKEQMEIAKSKEDGELLNWGNLQKMKYSWNVACEVMRLTPPALGAFREAITDFTFQEFSISKGSKLHWTVFSTHKDSEFFPDPEKFDPSRFEGSGPVPYTFVPFGGGPRMCPGKEFVRLEILVFMHHLVKRFKWKKIIPDEKIMWNPTPIPVKSLPIKLYPHITN